MGGVAEGIEDGVQLLRDGGGAGDHIAGGNHQVLGKGTVPVDTHALGTRAKVTPAGAAVAADAADDVALAGDQLSHAVALHVGADLHNLAHILMTGGHPQPDGVLGPLVPVPDMYIRAADGSLMNFDFHIVGAHRGNFYPLHGQPLLRLILHQSPHGTCLQTNHSF